MGWLGWRAAQTVPAVSQGIAGAGLGQRLHRGSLQSQLPVRVSPELTTHTHPPWDAVGRQEVHSELAADAVEPQGIKFPAAEMMATKTTIHV